MKHHAGLPDWEKLKQWSPQSQRPYVERVDDELRRLYAIESAALEVIGSMGRRNGRIVASSYGTIDTIINLEKTLQQEEES
jgi:hypothetical protein